MMEALTDFLRPEPKRKPGPMMRIRIGMCPRGCASCSHCAFVRTVRARSVDQAVDLYAARLPQANPTWAKVIVMEVGRA